MGENITPVAELCRRYGLTQKAMARLFGIPLPTVHDWHSGRRKAPDYVVGMMTLLLEHNRNRIKIQTVAARATVLLDYELERHPATRQLLADVAGLEGLAKMDSLVRRAIEAEKAKRLGKIETE